MKLHILILALAFSTAVNCCSKSWDCLGHMGLIPAERCLEMDNKLHPDYAWTATNENLEGENDDATTATSQDKEESFKKYKYLESLTTFEYNLFWETLYVKSTNFQLDCIENAIKEYIKMGFLDQNHGFAKCLDEGLNLFWKKLVILYINMQIIKKLLIITIIQVLSNASTVKSN